MPGQIDSPIWLSAQAAPGSLMVPRRVCLGPEVWGVPLGPLPYEFLGGMVHYGPRVTASEVGAWFQSPTGGTSHGPYLVLRCMPSLSLPQDGLAVEKEMEQLARELRQRRRTLGYSQADVGFAVGALCGKVLSQTTICRFEAQQLSLTNMWKLRPLLKMWLEEVDTKNFLGLCKMEMILQQARKWRRLSRERRIGNSLEKLFLQCPKPTPQQISHLSGQLQLQKDLVEVWFCNHSKMGSVPTSDFSSLEGTEVARPPFPGAPVCFPLASGLRFSTVDLGVPCFTPLYSSAPLLEGGTLLATPTTTLGLPRLSH